MNSDSFLGMYILDKNASIAVGNSILEILYNLVDEFNCRGSDLRNYFNYTMKIDETVNGEIDKFRISLFNTYNIITVYDCHTDKYKFNKQLPLIILL